MNGSLLIQEERIQSLTDSISNAVHIVQDYSIVHANRASIRLHGYNSISDVIGKDIFSFGIQSKDKEWLRKMHDDNVRGINTDKTMPEIIRARDGRIFRIKSYPNRIIWNRRPAVLAVGHYVSKTADFKKSFHKKAGESIQLPYKSQFGQLDNKDPRLKVLGSSKAMQK